MRLTWKPPHLQPRLNCSSSHCQVDLLVLSFCQRRQRPLLSGVRKTLLSGFPVCQIPDEEDDSYEGKGECKRGRETFLVFRRVGNLPNKEWEPCRLHVLNGVDHGNDESTLLGVVGTNFIHPAGQPSVHRAGADIGLRQMHLH